MKIHTKIMKKCHIYRVREYSDNNWCQKYEGIGSNSQIVCSKIDHLVD